MVKKVLAALLFLIAGNAFAQIPGIDVRYGSNTFTTIFDTSNYSTTLTIKNSDGTLYSGIFPGRIDTVSENDLNNDGVKEYLIDNYSGGAHCCTFLYLGKFTSAGFELVDSISWGNSFYTIEDINKDGKYEISGMNDEFAYYFTNYAQSQFQILIYGLENDRFVNVTSRFPELIEKDIKMHFSTYGEITNNTSYDCPNPGEDTFNTTAGAVKAMLAPIVADYYTLGNVARGYEIVDSIYKCPDAGAFKDTLRTVFKLK